LKYTDRRGGTVTQPDSEANAGASHTQHDFEIHIDRKPYKVPFASRTGAELRQIAQPVIGADHDLYLEVPGGQDQLIADDEVVELKNGMHFFSIQKHITPGGRA
jgi:Multiubiquitin